jgi:hypothetical protein
LAQEFPQAISPPAQLLLQTLCEHKGVSVPHTLPQLPQLLGSSTIPTHPVAHIA